MKKRPAAESSPKDPFQGGESDLLPHRLPSWVARSIGLFLILIFATALTGSLMIRFPQTIRCPFVLLPAAGADPIHSPIRGVVDRILTQEGKEVRKGEVLFQIRSSEVRDRGTELLSLEQDLLAYPQQQASLLLEAKTQRQVDAAEMDRLVLRQRHLSAELRQAQEKQKISRGRYEVSLRIQRFDIAQILGEMKFRQEYQGSFQDFLQRMEVLREKELIAQIELIRNRLEYSRAVLETEQSRRALDKAKLKLEEMEADRLKEQNEEKIEIQRYDTEYYQTQAALEKLRQEIKIRQIIYDERLRDLTTRIEKARVRKDALRKELQESRGDFMLVVAPYAGTLLRLAKKVSGDVVEHGQELCQIARSEADLRAELNVPEEAVAKLRAGQSVKLLLNAFPYQRYGARNGIIQWVSPAAVASKEGKSFKAFVALKDKAIALADGVHAMRAGMQGEAQVIIDRPLLIEVIFEPLRRLKESMADLPPPAPSQIPEKQ